MKAFLSLFVFLSSLPALAESGHFVCNNPATSAGVVVFDMASGGGRFSIDGNMRYFLRGEGAAYIPEYGFGLNNGDTQFIDYVATGTTGHLSYRLQLKSDSGGVQLSYTTSHDVANGKAPITYFFNPGECWFN